MRKVFVILIVQLLALAAYTQTQCGSTNIAYQKTVTPSLNQNGPGNIVDGNTNSNWFVNTGGSDQWVYVDLTQPYVVCRIVVKWITWGYVSPFKIQGSDNATTWVDLLNVSDAPEAAEGNAYHFHDKQVSGTTAYRYIRLYLPNMAAFNHKVLEFEIYNSTGGGGGGGTDGPEWYTTGNTGITASHFLGPVNDMPLVFKTNNVERLSIHGDADNAKLKLSGSLNGNLSIDFSAAGNAYHRITSHANNGFLDIIAGATGGGHSIRFFTDNNERGKIDNLGTWHIGGVAGKIMVDPFLSRPNDRIKIGGHVNITDGQNVLFSTSSDGGLTYKRLIVERDGHLGIGVGNAGIGWQVANPALRFHSDGRIAFGSTMVFFGSEGGPFNASSLLTYVSNPNEWHSGAGNYPNGENTYYFGTILQAPEPTTPPAIPMKRAPLVLGGRELRFAVGGQGDIGIPGTEAARFSEDANLLIGTTTDNGNKLQVNGTVWTSGLIVTTGAASGKVLTSDADGRATWQTPPGGPGGSGWLLGGNGGTNPSTDFIGTTDIADFAIRTGFPATEKMRIGANGIVGIGVTDLSNTSFTGYRLIVKDGIKTKRVRVETQTWPDYVFHKSYQLPTLEFVEEYISKHRHLPDVPSAEEVIKEGLDLGDNQAVLLKKIEELTLYLIEQNKKIIEQQKQIQEQQQRIEKLEKKISK